MRNLTELQLGYVAAMIDGEGSIALGRSWQRTVWGYIPVVSVSNTNITLMHWMRVTTEIGVIRPKTQTNPRAKKGYFWQLRVDEIEEFLVTVKPALVIKQRQAELMLEFLTTIRTPTDRRPLTLEEIALKELIYEELGELNKTGVGP